MADLGWVDLERVWAVQAREDRRFAAERPRSMELLARARASMPSGIPNTWFRTNYDHPPVFVIEAKGSRFTDADDHEYVDFFIGICTAFCGHAPDAVAEAVARQARRGLNLQLPTEDAIWVAEELSRRFAPLRWQFALTASQAILDCIRLARATTGRERILKFDANYHGHLDATMLVVEGGAVAPEYQGQDLASTRSTKVIPFNDPGALEEALTQRDVAVAIAEPAMTNVGFITPEPGYHEILRRLTRETGTLLLIDETQTLLCGHGGLTREYGLDPDLFVLGKSIAGGVPFAAYGMNERLAQRVEAPHAHYEVAGEAVDEIALGGTMWANALTVAAARAALEHVLTEEAYARTVALGGRLADGLETAIDRVGLPWAVQRLYTRAAYVTSPVPPRNGAEARDADIAGFKDAQRVFMANRGIWDAGWWMGPSLCLAHTADEVDRYLEVFGEFLSAIG
jgi:glutamate-1-semialdehyde 2,1-aminomutase